MPRLPGNNDSPRLLYRGRSMKTVLNPSLIWAAGLFDGEGCVGIYRRSLKAMTPVFREKLHLSMTHEATVRKFCEIMGVGAVSFRRSRRKKWRPVWVWQTSNHQAQIALERLLPFLVTKRAEAEFAREFAKYKAPAGHRLSAAALSARTVIIEKLKALKKETTA